MAVWWISGLFVENGVAVNLDNLMHAELSFLGIYFFFNNEFVYCAGSFKYVTLTLVLNG